jgi:hypothetical protein
MERIFMSSEVEEEAIKIIMNFERRQGRTPTDVSRRGVGYDILSEGDGEKRCIEVKSRSGERQTFVTMDGGLLKRLGNDVNNYYLYLIRKVRTKNPTLRIVPPSRVLSNLQTVVRYRFAVTRKSMESIEEIVI